MQYSCFSLFTWKEAPAQGFRCRKDSAWLGKLPDQLFVTQPACLFWPHEKYTLTQPNKWYCFMILFFEKRKLVKVVARLQLWWQQGSARNELSAQWGGNLESGINPLGLGSRSTHESLYSFVTAQQRQGQLDPKFLADPPVCMVWMSFSVPEQQFISVLAGSTT